MQFRLLQYSEAQKFLEFMKENNIDDIDSFFVAPFFDLDGYDELSLKDSLFKFNIFIYCSYVNDKLEKCIVLKLNGIGLNSTTMSIEFMSKKVEKGFLDSCVECISEILKDQGITKIKILNFRYQLSKQFEEILLSAGFKQELVLPFYDSKLDRLIYSHIL